MRTGSFPGYGVAAELFFTLTYGIASKCNGGGRCSRRDVAPKGDEGGEDGEGD